MCASRAAVPAATMRAAEPAACDCIYGCSVDADCGPGELCVCGPDLGSSASACVPASCSSGSDCASGVCGLSIYDDGCRTTRRIACKTSDDECNSDDDCKPNERKKPTKCVFVEEEKKGQKARWACRAAECQVGRPLLLDGVVHAAPAARRCDWLAAEIDGTAPELSNDERALVKEHWLRAGALEHASIASFARFSLQLLAMGAPADLVRETQAAMGDEIEHAKTCYAIARLYGAEASGPSTLPAATAPISSDARQIAAALVAEGCIGEALAAAEAAILADRCEVPEVARALRRIAEDEQRHAALAYRALAWMASAHGAIVDEVVEDILAAQAWGPAPREDGPGATGPARHGVFGDAEARALKARAVSLAIRPALAAAVSRAEAAS